MTEPPRAPSAADRWLAAHRGAVLVAAALLGLVGILISVTTDGRSGAAWLFYAPSLILIGLGGRARSLARQQRD